jgi:hypothetical protein
VRGRRTVTESCAPRRRAAAAAGRPLLPRRLPTAFRRESNAPKSGSRPLAGKASTLLPRNVLLICNPIGRRHRLGSLLPQSAFILEKTLNSQRSLPSEVGHTLASWIVAQVKIVVILTGIYAIGFAVSRVPWWLAVAAVCGLLNFIPVAGPVIALLIVLPVTWLIRQDAIPVLGALITYISGPRVGRFLFDSQDHGPAARSIAVGCVSRDFSRRVSVRAARGAFCGSGRSGGSSLVAASPARECLTESPAPPGQRGGGRGAIATAWPSLSAAAIRRRQRNAPKLRGLARGRSSRTPDQRAGTRSHRSRALPCQRQPGHRGGGNAASLARRGHRCHSSILRVTEAGQRAEPRRLAAAAPRPGGGHRGVKSGRRCHRCQ